MSANATTTVPLPTPRAWKLFGSLKNVARRLLDSIRFVAWDEGWFDPAAAGKLRIELNTS